jgi:adenosine deaminase
MRDDLNILVTTFGTTWAILPELIGFTNPEAFDFYRNHSKNKSMDHVMPVDELWVVHTDSQRAKKAIEAFELWKDAVSLKSPVIRFFSIMGVEELGTKEECFLMTDLIFRVVLHAREVSRNGQLIISLTGGRKNMSADIQRASDIFGCDFLIHIADNIRQKSVLQSRNPFDFISPLAAEEINQLDPMILHERKPPNAILFVDTPVMAQDYELKEGAGKPLLTLKDQIETRLKNSDHLLFNSYRSRMEKASQSSFYGLQLLSPQVIGNLENEYIGLEKHKSGIDYQWLKSLPKSDLHCHLGGILNVNEIIEVALVLIPEIELLTDSVPGFSGWMESMKNAVRNHNKSFLQPFVSESKHKLRELDGIPDPFGLASFLCCFEGKEKLLEELIYGELLSPINFTGIGIERYMKLGDLQGSGLLKHRLTIERACQILIRKCRDHNVRYLELRCSPANYQTKELSINEIVEIIHRVLTSDPEIRFGLIIIGSRHNNPDLLREHIDLADFLSKDGKYNAFFSGFDVAGNESIMSPKMLKNELSQLLRSCAKMTIHAGEGVDPQNIWEAVYELNADRIGHGLTLIQRENLMKRFADRKVAVEMCPSSNQQIIGYRNHLLNSAQGMPQYPLKVYFDAGIRVTINTDNPGISRTDISNEYILAAQMSGGISKWDILKIVRNGFKAAFLTPEDKKRLIIQGENEISTLCNL